MKPRVKRPQCGEEYKDYEHHDCNESADDIRRECINAVCKACRDKKPVTLDPDMGTWVHTSEQFPGVPVRCAASGIWELVNPSDPLA